MDKRCEDCRVVSAERKAPRGILLRSALVVALVLIGVGPAPSSALPVLSAEPQIAGAIALVGLSLPSRPIGTGTACGYASVPASNLAGSAGLIELSRNDQVIERTNVKPVDCSLVVPRSSPPVELPGAGVLASDISLPGGEFKWERATKASQTSTAVSDPADGSDLVSADAAGTWFSVHAPATATDPAVNAVAQQAAARIVTGVAPGRSEATAEAQAAQSIDIPAGNFSLAPELGAISLWNDTLRGRALVYFEGRVGLDPDNPRWWLFAEALPGAPAVTEHPEDWLKVEFHSTFSSIDDAAITRSVIDNLVEGFSAGQFSLGKVMPLFSVVLKNDSAYRYSQSAAAYVYYVPEPATLALLGIAVAGLGFARRKLNSVAHGSRLLSPPCAGR